MNVTLRTIVTAAGRGVRLGADKALVPIGDATAIERIVTAHAREGIDDIVVVRRTGAAALPALAARVVCADPPEMIDSLRAGWRESALDVDGWILFHPVDYPLAADGVLPALRERCASTAARIVLPLCGGRPGHPIALHASLGPELLDAATTSLRDVIRRDPGRVDVVPVTNPWILRDLDEPCDLVAARAWIDRPSGPVTAVMRQHRSRRRYHPAGVPSEQVRWIVDCARHGSTSSMMQAYAVVAVRDPERRGRIAELCSDQAHIREAGVFLAVCADLHKIERACARHGGELQGDSLEVFLQATIDAAIFGQNIQLAAESEGLGTCMIGAARNHPVALARLLELPSHAFVAFGMTLGWPADDPIPRGRMPIGAVLHDEIYAEHRLEADLDAADEGMRAWASRTNQAFGGYAGRPVDEVKGWTDRMARLWGRPAPAKGRENLCAELRQLGFGLGRVSDED